LKDFVPLALGPKTPNIITVNPSVAAKTLPELVEAAKKTPMSYASSGIGTTTHLSMERLKTAAKVDITHVPYQPAAAINAVVAGHTPMASTSMPPAVPQIKAGKLKALAVTSAQRSAALPDLPTVEEAAGLKGFEASSWFGLLAPAGTPPDVVSRIQQEVAKSLASPAMKERLATLGAIPSGNTPAQFAALIEAEHKKWAEVVKASGAKVD
jgi:tripartite-type tricarboxylate transporter receptor subunit TctC